LRFTPVVVIKLAGSVSRFGSTPSSDSSSCLGRNMWSLFCFALRLQWEHSVLHAQRILVRRPVRGLPRPVVQLWDWRIFGELVGERSNQFLQSNTTVRQSQASQAFLGPSVLGIHHNSRSIKTSAHSIRRNTSGSESISATCFFNITLNRRSHEQIWRCTSRSCTAGRICH
jgi:hypothetical protein